MGRSKELTPKERRFCQEYTFDWNATRAAQVAGYSHKTAYAIGNKLLKKADVQSYISNIQNNIEKLTNTSKLRVIAELEKIAYNSISRFHNTWIERKEFEQISEADKAAISEISTKVVKQNVGTEEVPIIADVEYVKIKLWDKNKALETLNKMLGYNLPEKVDMTSKGEKLSTPQSKAEILAELEEIQNRREGKSV